MKGLKLILFFLAFVVVAYSQPGYWEGFSSSESPRYSTTNTTTTPLLGNATYTGTGDQTFLPDVMVTVNTDQPGTLFFEFSEDDINWSTFPVNGFDVAAGINEFHTAVKGGRYFRARYVNSALPQAFFRLYTQFGTYRAGNIPLNQSIGPDSDAELSRSVLAGEILDPLLNPSSTYQNVNVNQRGGILMTSPAEVLFQRVAPGDGTFLSGTSVAINPVLNVEPNVYDSGWFPSRQWNAATTRLGSDVSLKAYIMNASDTLGNNIQGNTTPAIINAAGFSSTISAAMLDDYVRIVVVNDSGTNTDEYSIRMLGGDKGVDPIVASLGTQLQDFFYAPLIRSVTTGRQPDGDYVNTPADGSAFFYDSNALPGGTVESSWIDTDGYNTIQVFIQANQVGAVDGIKFEFTEDANIATPIVNSIVTYNFTAADVERGYLVINERPQLDGARVSFTVGQTTTALMIDVALRTSVLPKTNDQINNGISRVSVAGFNLDVTSGVVEDVWNSDGEYTGFPDDDLSAPTQIRVTDADDANGGNGCKRIRITGLISNTSTEYTTSEVSNNTIIFPGTVLSGNWWRVSKLECIEIGSSGSNTGEIIIERTVANGGDVLAVIAPGDGVSQMATYTVPLGSTAYLESMYGVMARSNAGAGSGLLILKSRLHNANQPTGFIRTRIYPITGAMTASPPDGSQVAFPARTDIKLSLENASANNIFVSGELNLRLEKN